MVNVGKYTIHGSYGCLLLYRISGEKKSWPKKYVGYPVAYTNPSEVTAGVSLNFARQWGRHHAIDFGRKRKGWFRLNICCTAWNLWVCPLFRSVPKISNKKDQIPIKTRVTSSCSYRYIWCDPYGKSCLFQVPSCLFYHASFRSPGSNWGGDTFGVMNLVYIDQHPSPHINLPSLKLTANATWKWMVGISFWGPAYFQVRKC